MHKKAGIALSELVDLHTVVRHMGQVQTLKPVTKFCDECETTTRKSRDVGRCRGSLETSEISCAGKFRCNGWVA